MGHLCLKVCCQHWLTFLFLFYFNQNKKWVLNENLPNYPRNTTNMRFFVCYFFFSHQMIKKIKKQHACAVVESFVNISNSVHLK